MMATVIRPADDLGPVLTSREIASSFRERIEERARAGETVVLDFTGVEAMSPSLADEIFARIAPDLVISGCVQFENLDEDLLSLMRFVVAGRAAQTESA